MRQAVNRSAFTLLEMLVALVVIGLLLGLLLPAIGKVREAANRMGCAINLKQLGLAAAHYDCAFQKLPPGYLGPRPERGADPQPDYRFQFVGVLPYLLPYLEQGVTHDRLSADLPADYFSTCSVYPGWWTYPSAFTAAETKIQLFLCPSDDASAAGAGTDLVLHPVRLESEGWQLIRAGLSNTGPGNALGRTNYLGVSGYSGVIGVAGNDLLAGCLYNRSGVRICDVAAADGTSNTLLFGESSSPAGALLPARSWMGTGAMPVAFGVPSDTVHSGWWHFSSQHPGIVQFCLCDGSVRGIRKGLLPGSTDYDILIRAAAWHDGTSIDLTGISN
jgi:prepilin-type N-terminal cleavage/methylation domain-containing protein